ncbi:MAG TPA: sigma-70 family RNA polymerase sigma factor, partial [Hyphomicrobiaceae bacterium]|nr:sigma-70 family RNA polymerase sigma factor [Hyphomicrobiaceae bacterium]
MNDIVADHDRLRSLMFSIAYRMLGSVAEAEDIAQEAFLRMHQRPATINSIEAYAATVTTRLAIDHLRAARVRRERYVGTWLPEPLVASGTDLDPAAHIEAADTLSIAFFVVLERLSPIERAVFLLREVFAYEYSDIATIVGKTASNCRQILTRAKARLLQPSRRFEVAPARRETLAQQFFAACHDGDLGGLERILAQDV